MQYREVVVVAAVATPAVSVVVVVQVTFIARASYTSIHVGLSCGGSRIGSHGIAVYPLQAGTCSAFSPSLPCCLCQAASPMHLDLDSVRYIYIYSLVYTSVYIYIYIYLSVHTYTFPPRVFITHKISMPSRLASSFVV